MHAHLTEAPAPDSYYGRSLALLVADALACTPDLQQSQRDLLVAALQQIAKGEVEEEHEAAWFTLFLNAGLHTTPAFDPKGPLSEVPPIS